jgi:hypothetical protein
VKAGGHSPVYIPCNCIDPNAVVGHQGIFRNTALWKTQVTFFCRGYSLVIPDAAQRKSGIREGLDSAKAPLRAPAFAAMTPKNRASDF